MSATRGRPPPWRSARARRIAIQLAFLGLVFAGYWYVAGNLVGNMRRLDFDLGFGFLDQAAGFAIPDSDFESTEPVRRAIAVGVRNTIAVSATGILLATILGVLVGIARLSHNWLVRRAAGTYVEILRNVPLVVVIFFVYTAAVLRMPPLSRAREWLGALVLSNSGIAVPSPASRTGSNAFNFVVVAALVAGVVVWVWRTRTFERTGRPARRIAWSGGLALAIVVVGYMALGAPVGLSLPERQGPRIAGGIVLNPEFAALLIGLVIYTASHIAEVVRGSVLAIPKGQSEAALALGLSNAQRLRLIVLPQAFRIMLPPLANQYLNLTKNSSLAIVIGFPEVTRVIRIAIGQGSPAPQAIAVLMLVYLVISLTISGAANLLNRRLGVATR